MPVQRGSVSSGSLSSVSSEDEQDYLDALTRKQVLELNEAFDAGAGSHGDGSSRSSKAGQPASKRRRVGESKGKGKAKAEAPGGFIVDGAPDDVQAAGGFFPEDDDSTNAGGGFIPEDDDTASFAGGGGFMPADDEVPAASGSGSHRRVDRGKASTDKPKSLLLDNIPQVIDSLGLDGDDGSILSIFENASFSDPAHEGLQAVKRKDFLKVAALLIKQRDDELAQDRDHKRTSQERSGRKKSTLVQAGGGKGRVIDIDADEQNYEEDDSDPLVLSSNEDDDEESDDFNRNDEDSDPWADEDDLDGAFTPAAVDTGDQSARSKRRQTRSRAKKGAEKSDDSASPGPEDAPTSSKRSSMAKGKRRASDDSKKLRLSSKQRDECEKMFQQFFFTSDRKRNSSISVEEIRYVATLLNEKLSDEDVIEMLEYASTTRNRSVDLDAFSQIMVDIKAV